MGRAPCCDKSKVKRGPWSQEEDVILKTYIDQNGTGGNWIALPQKIGLKRCGKSCRLRWLNYLRPNIKHGDFSDEENQRICELFVSIGSRWSVIAAQLPGRTDNDIKNYWNTKLKKKLLGPSQPRNTLLMNQGVQNSETGLINSNAIERMQLQLQLQGAVQRPFSFYNNQALWPKSQPLVKLNVYNDVVISPNNEQPMVNSGIQEEFSGSFNLKYNELNRLSDYQGMNEINVGKDMNMNMNWWDFNGFEDKSSSCSEVFQESSSVDGNGFDQEYALDYDLLA